MAEPEARSFFQQHSSESWFQELCSSMAERGETTALCICKSQGVASLQSLVGPANLNKVPDGLYAVRRIAYLLSSSIALHCFCSPFSLLGPKGLLNGPQMLLHHVDSARCVVAFVPLRPVCVT